MTCAASSGHPGGSLSEADILAALYFHIMRIDPQNPKKGDRDRLIDFKRACLPWLVCGISPKGLFPG